MFVNDNTIEAERLGNFFGNQGRSSALKQFKKGLKSNENLGPALEIGAKIGTNAVSKNPKAAFSTIPIVISFYHNMNGPCLEKFV